MATSTRTRRPSAITVEQALATLAAAGHPVATRAQAQAQATAQREAAQTVITPDFVSSVLGITGGVRQSTAEPKPGQTPWVGASLDRVPVTTDDGGEYTVKLVITQKKAPAGADS